MERSNERRRQWQQALRVQRARHRPSGSLVITDFAPFISAARLTSSHPIVCVTQLLCWLSGLDSLVPSSVITSLGTRGVLISLLEGADRQADKRLCCERGERCGKAGPRFIAPRDGQWVYVMYKRDQKVLANLVESVFLGGDQKMKRTPSYHSPRVSSIHLSSSLLREKRRLFFPASLRV